MPSHALEVSSVVHVIGALCLLEVVDVREVLVVADADAAGSDSELTSRTLPHIAVADHLLLLPVGLKHVPAGLHAPGYVPRSLAHGPVCSLTNGLA